MSTDQTLPISKDLLEILRDPLAVQDKAQYGDDPGQLDLVHNCWLVSKDTGLKYPIKEGIPVMLIDEGMKWKDTSIDDLPVPPPPLIPESSMPAGSDSGPVGQPNYGGGSSPLVYILGGLGALVVLYVLWRLLFRR